MQSNISNPRIIHVSHRSCGSDGSYSVTQARAYRSYLKYVDNQVGINDMSDVLNIWPTIYRRTETILLLKQEWQSGDLGCNPFLTPKMFLLIV